MTGQDIVNQALTLIGRLGAGRGAGTVESAVVFSTLNTMLDSWSTKRKRIYQVRSDTYALAAGTESYSLGTGQTWNGARPVQIESADIVATVGGSSKSSYFPLNIIGQKEFAKLMTLGDQADVPKALYCDYGWPNATVYLYPTPALAISIELYTWSVLAAIATLGTTVTLPQGYARALMYNLAVEIAPLFDRQVPEDVAEIAVASLEAIEGINSRLAPPEDLQEEAAAENQEGSKQ